jgi:GntR family transcriptional repressor for pyruvate dehydrogenase complex
LRDAISELLPRTLSWGLMDAAFHREIAMGSGNQVLQELLQGIRSLLRIWVDRALADDGHAAAALKEHGEIFAALEARDADAVARTMRSHMETASRRLLAGFDAAQ